MMVRPPGTVNDSPLSAFGRRFLLTEPGPDPRGWGLPASSP
jgi:hypothetical protein